MSQTATKPQAAGGFFAERLAQSDPDAPGRPRPRAPGRGLAAA